jgi:hypothetical protein
MIILQCHCPFCNITFTWKLDVILTMNRKKMHLCTSAQQIENYNMGFCCLYRHIKRVGNSVLMMAWCCNQQQGRWHIGVSCRDKKFWVNFFTLSGILHFPAHVVRPSTSYPKFCLLVPTNEATLCNEGGSSQSCFQHNWLGCNWQDPHRLMYICTCSVLMSSLPLYPLLEEYKWELSKKILFLCNSSHNSTPKRNELRYDCCLSQLYFIGH